ncbi:MAG TPA: metallophosphoesterase [Gammaproteobacteria bacterium]|nr:metallophosphoesterase [Gammaproteobacteria bacterium]
MSQPDRNFSSKTTRRGLLKCAAWAGAGVVWTMRAGVLSSVELLEAARAADKPQGGGLSFVQISDSHIGFGKEPNPAPQVTLQSAIDRIRSLPRPPSFIVHTGDVSHLSKAEELDTAAEIVKGAGTTAHYVPGEHDVIGDDGRGFFTRFNGSADRKWYSFDTDGAHFVALTNVLDLKAGGFGRIGMEQLEWLGKDLKGRSASTPIVVLAHMPLWTVYADWGWGTDDAPQALSYLKRFGSVTVLNGHIHQVMQKVEGNLQFHTARSTAFPQPAPGTAPSPGPLKVPAEMLRSVLGISSVTSTRHLGPLAIVDATLPPAAQAAARTIVIGNFTFSPANVEVPAGTTLTWSNEDDEPHTVVSADGNPAIKSPPLDTGEKYATLFDRPGTYGYFCSLHPHMTGTVVVR